MYATSIINNIKLNDYINNYINIVNERFTCCKIHVIIIIIIITIDNNYCYYQKIISKRCLFESRHAN